VAAPPGWLPPASDGVLGRGAEYGYRATEIAALRAMGIDF
jgi:hypothetical protein